MVIFRSLLFYCVAFIPTAIFCTTGLLCLAMPQRALVLYVRLWLRSIFFILKHIQGISCRIEGIDNLPKGPFIIASKHQSALETLIFPVLFDHPYIIMKKELSYIPFWGWMVPKYGAILLDRQNAKESLKRLIEKGEEGQKSGRPLLIFPEGTRTCPGEQSTYKTGIAILYDHLKIPVVPIAVNTGVFWGRKSFFKKPGLATMRILSPILPGYDKRQFMDTLHKTIEDSCEALLDEAKLLERASAGQDILCVQAIKGHS